MTTPYLLADLTRDEGKRPFPYRDSRGHWTIGVGHNLDADPAMKARLADLRIGGLFDREIEDLLARDVAAVQRRLDAHLPWWRDLDDVRQDVIVNLAFNLGEPTLETWKHTLGDVARGAAGGDFHAAAVDLRADQPWASQVHARAERLARQLETGVRAWAS